MDHHEASFVEETRKMMIELQTENFNLRRQLEDQDRLKQKLFLQNIMINDLIMQNWELKRVADGTEAPSAMKKLKA
jgi:hypothetical protein